jgi:RecJ-like exonuclease
MILKIWCDKCFGEGSINSGGKECPDCQGKGYKEIEADFEGAPLVISANAITGYDTKILYSVSVNERKNIKVYIKEIEGLK